MDSIAVGSDLCLLIKTTMYKNSKIKKILSLLILVISMMPVYGQSDSLQLSLYKVFDIALDKNRDIKLSTDYLLKADLNVSDKTNSKLPNIGFSASAGYLTNVGVLGLGNMPDGFYDMPHFANSYALQASLLVYAGDRINTDISISKLERDLAALSVQRNTQNIKLILAGYYLDLYQLYQQKKVYEKNIVLSKELLKKINDRYTEGVALKSDKIRNELLLSTFELALSKLLDQIQITNNNLNATLDLPENTIIVPDKSVDIPLELQDFLVSHKIEELKAEALNSNPDSKESETKLDIAAKKLKIVRSFNLPDVSLFFSGTMNRPYTYDIPAKDIYANNNTVGVRVNIPIGNLYLSKKKIEMAEKDIDIAKQSREIITQNLSRDVKNNFIRCKQAYDQLTTLDKQQELADENYRRISDNYIEQLALNTEVMDATNQKLEADLRISQAKVQIVYAYYQLLKTLGQL
jgi:outer membrane protein TolC